MKKYIISVFFFFISVVVKSQDFVYSNYLMSPIYLNPALAGTSKEINRLIVKGRWQHPGINNAYKYSSISYDRYVNRYLAFAVEYEHSKEGAGFYKKNNLGLNYSFQRIRFDSKKNKKYRNANLQIALGLKLNYGWRNIDYDNLIFYDQIDIENGIVSGLQSEANIPIHNNEGFFDASVGMVFLYGNTTGGFAVHHLFEPNEALITNESLIRRKYVIHFSQNVNMSKKNGITFSEHLFYQDKLPVVLLGCQYKISFISIGPWVRSVINEEGGNTIICNLLFDDMDVMKGKNGITLGISYEYNILGISNRNTDGAFEFNLLLHSGKSSSKNKRIICPTF